MRKETFVETCSVLALRSAVSAAFEAGAGQPAMLMTYGEPGTGKTKAARSLYAEQGGIYLRALEGMTQNAFLQALCFEVDGTTPHGSARSKQTILSALSDEPRPIFVDEADRLHVGRLEDLRDIHDVTGSPIVLIGEMGLPTKVRARERINDRIPAAFRVHFDAITAQDILVFAKDSAELTLTPEAAALVRTVTKGNFRRVYNAMLSLERAAKVANSNDVNAEICRVALELKEQPKGRRAA